MEWWAPELEAAGERLVRLFSAAAWPDPPAGFSALGKIRSMRMVVRGAITGTGRLPGDATHVVVKWNRPVTLTDRVARWLRGGRGAREGRTLRKLAAHDLSVPKVVGYSDRGVDILVLETLEDVAALPPWSAAPASLVEDVAGLLAGAYLAGLRHGDLHKGNIMLADGRPVMLDVGGSQWSRGRGLERELARARHGVFGDASTSQRLRALRVWTHRVQGDVTPEKLHRLAGDVERAARRVTRAYRRGRDRRATRTGRHFQVFHPAGGGLAVRRCGTPEVWKTDLFSDLREGRVDDGQTVLKEGRVIRLHSQARGTEVVVKRYPAVAPGRLPRSIRAFRTAVALAHRGVPAPEALLAVAFRDRTGVLVSEYVDAPDLHRFTLGGRGGEYAALPRAARLAFLTALGRFLRRMHEEEVSHRDLKAPNLVVQGDGAAGFSFVVTDVEGARVRHGEVPWQRRARDLARLDASLGAAATDRLRVLDAYWRVHPQPRVAKRAFLGWVARAVAKKRGPSGRPR